MRKAATKPQNSEDPPIEHVAQEATVESPESGHSLVDTIKSRPKSFHGKKRPPSKKFLRDTLVKQNDSSSLSGDLLFGFEGPSSSSERPFSNCTRLLYLK
ncbi:hypothetical protein MXB_2940 [Myxobolus squamalis]|nr:hypothetical protein MXB_2940 [Myxobolus squamalis]